MGGTSKATGRVRVTIIKYNKYNKEEKNREIQWKGRHFRELKWSKKGQGPLVSSSGGQGI